MTDRQLILSFFDDEVAADTAAAALKDSGMTEGDALGILALDPKGHLKQDKMGKRSTGKGAGIGAALLLLGPAAMGVGIAGGAAAGALHHKGLGLTEADKVRITAELTKGRAAVGVLVPYEDATAISERLGSLGGTPESHLVTDGSLEAAAETTAAEG